MPDKTPSIEAVPRRYAGVNFRSTLEADWAATLDDLEVLWEYEPKAVTLPSGATYIPDFFLPEIGTWIEVKGPGVPRVEKAREFAATVACPCQGRGRCVQSECQIVLIGHPPKDARRGWDGTPYWSTAIGDPAYLAICSPCRRHYWHRSNRPACRHCGNVADFYLAPTHLKFGEASRLLSDLSGGPLREDHAQIVGQLGDAFRKMCGKPQRRSAADGFPGLALMERAS